MRKAGALALALLMATPAFAQERRIKLRAEGGAYYVPVLINGKVQLEFQVDTGANAVTMPSYAGLTVMGSGTMTKSDIGTMGEAHMANDSTVKILHIRLSTLQVGSGSNVVVGHSIVGSIGDENTSLLLGTTFFEQFKSFQIDHSTGELVIDDAPNPHYVPHVFASAPPQESADPPPRQAPRRAQPAPGYMPGQSDVYGMPAPPQPYSQPYYPQPYYPQPYYAPAPAPCPACVVGGVLGGILGGAILGARRYGGWGGYRGGWGRGWHR